MNRPYGYKDRKEQRIRRTMEEWSAKGQSYSSIAAQLNEQGKRTRQGKTWTAGTVANVLSRPSRRGKPEQPPEEQEQPGFGNLCMDALTIPVETTTWDDVAGKYKTRVMEFMSEGQAREDREEQRRALEAWKRFMEREKQKPFRFTEPMRLWTQTTDDVRDWFEPIYGDWWNRMDVDAIVKRVTDATHGHDVHALLDQIEGQPGVKGPLRRSVNLLLGELAVQRQTNLALRQKLADKIKLEPKVTPYHLPYYPWEMLPY